MGSRARDTLISVSSIAVFFLVWQVFAWRSDPTLVPGPKDVASAAVELGRSGELWTHISASLRRVFLGWLLGCSIAIPLGLLVGTSRIARAAIDPFIHFFRFIPALALVSIFILWFGIGEQSKVNLVAYAVAFIVTVNTAAGAASVSPDKIASAYCVGASRFAALRSVVFPATVPHIFTGMRLALGTAFLVIVAAEALATQSGIGFLIWNSRAFFRTDYVFVGIFCFGILGFVADRLWRLLGATVLGRYTRASGGY